MLEYNAIECQKKGVQVSIKTDGQYWEIENEEEGGTEEWEEKEEEE